MQIALLRFTPLLLLLCLAGCGQTGSLFLRMPDVTFAPLAPPLRAPDQTVWMPPVVTVPAPAPAASTHP